MCDTLISLKNNHTKGLKDILIFIANELELSYVSQWTANKIYKLIEETNISDKDLLKILSKKYNPKYILSEYNKYTVDQLRTFIIKSGQSFDKNLSKQKLIKFIIDNNINGNPLKKSELSDVQLHLNKLSKSEIRLLAKDFKIQQKDDGINVVKSVLIQRIEQYMNKHSLCINDINEILIKTKQKAIEEITVRDTVQGTFQQDHKIQYIIHLADIHIPQKDRFKEYKNVFKNFIEQINKPKLQNKTIVVICGDIFHKKVYQRSNAIILWNYLVKEITQLYPLFVITGNHDYDMTSNDNDWIASTFETNGFHHLNQCGEYVINNISLGISPLNSGKIYKMEESNLTRVQLYHGTVKGSQLFNGNVLNEGISMDSFGNYDYLLLGDIHKMQFLSDNVAYSGSMIQQNFGESVDKHGYIIWDLENKTKQFCEIFNEHAFLVVKINNDGFTFDDTILGMNKKYISVRYDMEVNNHEIIDKFQEYSREIGWEIVKYKVNKLYNTDINRVVDKPVVEKLDIVDYFHKKGQNDKLKEEVIKTLCELHEEIEHSVNVVDNLVSQWRIKTINFKNLFCFGNDIENQLDLTNSGIYKLFANNFMGKSSVLKVVKWALFQDESGINDFDVLHKSGNISDGYVKVVFQPLHSDKEYVLERNIVKDLKLKSTIRVEHKLFVGEEVLIGKENVNERLCDIVGTYEEFELVASVNNTDLGILHKNASTVFNKLFNLGRFSDYEQMVKELMQETKNDIKILQNEMENIQFTDSEKIDELQLQIDSIKSELSGINVIDLSELIKRKQQIFEEYKQIELMKEVPCEECTEELGEININKLREMQQRKEELRSMIRNVKIINEDIIMKNLHKYSTEIEMLEGRIKGCHDELEHMRRAINQYNQEMSNIKYTEVELYALIKAQELDYNKTKSIILEKLELGQISESDYSAIKFLITEHNYHDMMNELEQNKTISKKIKELENVIEEKTKKMDVDMKRYNEITHKRYQLELMLKENNANKVIQEKNMEFEKEIEVLTHDLTEMHEVEIRNKTILEKRRAFKSYQEAVAHNAKHRGRKIELEAELAECEDLLGNKVAENQRMVAMKMMLENKLDTLVSQKTECIEDNEKLECIKNKLFKKFNNLELYNLYRGFVQESGVPTLILHDKLPMIEKDVNSVLSRYTNFRIVVEFTGKRKSIEIYQVKKDEKISLGSLSGYETLITNIAFKVAIKRNCNLHCPNFIMIDEVLSSVSFENYDMLPELFELLESCYDIIFLITHIQDIKELCEGNGIDVRLCREDGVSWIDRAA